MRLKNTLILDLLFCSCVFSSIVSCKEQSPDAFKCILITVDDKGNTTPVDEWEWYCKNPVTKQVKTISIEDSNRCIDNNRDECKWIGTDLQSYEKILKFYNGKCGK